MFGNRRDVDVLLGKVLTDIRVANDEIWFHTADGETYLMFHDRECCEEVTVEDIVGDLNDLIGRPITMAEEITGYGDPLDEYNDLSYTWTFYRFATAKGYVTIRWYGTSNGYYSEEVDFEQCKRWPF